MTVDAKSVASLQYFLMDAAKRYRISSAGAPGPSALLASAASLDYVLLLASEHPAQLLDDGAAAARSVRETLERAAKSAFDVVESVLDAPDDAFDDFIERHVRRHCIFELVRDLLALSGVRSDDVAFRSLTCASEILDRRRRRTG